MGAQIKIGANVTEVKKAITELAAYTKRGLGKNSIALFDKDTTKILSGQADKVMESLERRSQRLHTLIKEYGKRMKESAGNAKLEYEYKEKLLRTTRQLVEIEKSRSSMSDATKALKGEGSLGNIKEALKNVPGVGKLMGIGGMGAAAGLALLYAGNRFRKGYGTFEDSADSRIALMGRGIRNPRITKGMEQAFASAGLTHEELRKAQMQSMDIFGASGSKESDILQRANFAKAHGVDLASLQGLGAGFRAQTGTKEANRDLLKLQASLNADAIDQAIGPYLETTAAMITDMRQNGMIDSGQIIGLMSGITKRTGAAPEQTAQQMMGLQSAVQNSTGENNAVLQEAFARAGLGGGTIGGVQAAIRSGGLLGLNTGDMKGLMPSGAAALQNIGATASPENTIKRIQGMLSIGNQLAPGEGTNQRLQRARFNMGLFGVHDEAKAMQIEDILRASTSKTAAEDLKKVSELMKPNEEKMLEINKSIDSSNIGILRAVNKMAGITQENMGEQVAPIGNMGKNLKLAGDRLLSEPISAISDMLGTSPEAKLKSALLSGKPLDSNAQALFNQGTPESITKSLQDEISQAKKTKEWDRTLNPGAVAGDELRISKLEAQLAQLVAAIQHQTTVQKEHLEVSKSGVHVQKNVEKETKKKAAQVPAGSGL